MESTGEVFDRMDAWRHFPSYQLERRADLFFTPYLAEALETKLGFAIAPAIVPEFPVRIGTIYPHTPINMSCKIDYVAMSSAGDKAIFVELKTESLSRREEQDRYLAAACEVGLPRLLEGVLEVFRATSAKRKYCCLLEHLERMHLLRIPPQMKEIMARRDIQGVTKASQQIEITTRASECLKVYVQPNGDGPEVISFQEFAAVVKRHDDPVSRRFARSLLEWADVQTGQGRIAKA